VKAFSTVEKGRQHPNPVSPVPRRNEAAALNTHPAGQAGGDKGIAETGTQPARSGQEGGLVRHLQDGWRSQRVEQCVLQQHPLHFQSLQFTIRGVNPFFFNLGYLVVDLVVFFQSQPKIFILGDQPDNRLLQLWKLRQERMM
jgi:hypothetical protein